MTAPLASSRRADARAAEATWHGYHIPVLDPPPGGAAALLVGALVPAVRSLSEAGLATRFFYLFYTTDVLELRLRIRGPRRAAGAIGRGLGPVAVAVGAAAAPYAAYDREAHYFGETWESVYAELLHERTTTLALALLAQPWPDRSAFGLAAAAAIGTLWAGTAHAADGLRRGLAFARSHANGPAVPGGPARAALAGGPGVDRLRASLGRRRDVREASALMGRLHRRGGRGPFVAVHGLHLFCNKLGLGFPEEAAAYEAAMALAGR